MSKALLTVILALLAVMSGAYGQKADSYEPNNEIGDASGINASQAISSSIFPAQDGDFYKIYIDNPGVLQAQLSDVPKDMKARMDFYGKHFKKHFPEAHFRVVFCEFFRVFLNFRRNDLGLFCRHSPSTLFSENL
jgi:hypothetical protein